MKKTFPNWDRNVLEGYLLNLFITVLADDEAKKNVEFHNNPHYINKAVDQVMYKNKWKKRQTKAKGQECHQGNMYFY